MSFPPRSTATVTSSAQYPVELLIRPEVADHDKEVGVEISVPTLQASQRFNQTLTELLPDFAHREQFQDVEIPISEWQDLAAKQG